MGVIANPKYVVNAGLQAKVKTVGRVIRAICIINEPIKKTKETKSCQIIIPQRQTGRKSDIFIMLVADIHQVCKKGFWVAVISTDIETNDPHSEIKPAFEVIGEPCEMFTTISELHEPVDQGKAAENVLRIYKLITGKDLDLENLPDDPTDY